MEEYEPVDGLADLLLSLTSIDRSTALPIGAIKFANVLRRQDERGGASEALDMADMGRAGDRRGDAFLRYQPGERDLSRPPKER